MNEPKTIKIDEEIVSVLKKTIRNSLEFEKLTGKQLNITGIVGEVLAAKEYNLGLVVNDINTEFDAIDENKRRVQIKTRRIILKKTTLLSKMPVSNEAKYDYAILIILDEKYNLIESCKVERESIANHFKDINKTRIENGKKSRNTMSISQFKKLAK